MPRTSLILDASVALKWFSATDESDLEQSLAIRNGHLNRDLQILVPDLFYYEVSNALAQKKEIPTEELQRAQ